MYTHGRLFYALALGLSLGTCVTAPALAQLSATPGAGLGPSPGMPKHDSSEDKPAPPEPDAVPGAKARAPAAPATRSATDMAPNDALFDAINRGDITAARDALARGADLGAVNVLGMTPLELSIDLGRNDISFLLLSMRGEDSGRGSRAVARDTTAAPAAPTKAETRQARVRTARATQPNVAPKKSTPPPKLFANDGGTPLPSAGFLGFGTRQASN
ncbi:MAG TPA: hypothetical protein VHO91_06590 [Rhodopila sp.]|nr:hypothetical protein [Rhodopila sp.]